MGSIVFAATLAISFNANAVSLAGYDTVIVSPGDIQSGTVESPTLGTLNIDPIIAYTFLDNSGDPTEIAWMTAVYGHLNIPDSVPTIEKIEFDTEADSDAYWTHLGDGIYTGELNQGNDNYLLKIGHGGQVKLDYDTFLYRNLADLYQATIDLAMLATLSGFVPKNENQQFDIYRVSHISEVPVPAAFWLFGTALIGFIGFSRRTKV
jgi:hypothetical protein